MKKIFISHSSKDRDIIRLFVDGILISGCGIDTDYIFCTSIEGLGIKTSDICLNEMGASWAIVNMDVKPFLLPCVNFNSIGTLFSVKQASKINNGYALDQLYEELTKVYDIKVSITRWNRYKEAFLLEIEKYRLANLNKPYPSPEDYFKHFLNEDVSLNNLFLKAHPTLLDCKAIFSKNYYTQAFKNYCLGFEQITEKYYEPLYPKYNFCRIYKQSVDQYDNKIFPGGMKTLLDNYVFNFNINLYRITFLENETSDVGYNFSFFCFVNNRWVFLPKPWRFIVIK